MDLDKKLEEKTAEKVIDTIKNNECRASIYVAMQDYEDLIKKYSDYNKKLFEKVKEMYEKSRKEELRNKISTK